MADLKNWGFRALLATAALVAVTRLGADPVPAPAVPPAAAGGGERIAVTPDRPLTLAGVQPGSVKSVLNVAGPMKYGDAVWREDGVPSGPVWIRVDRRAQTISIFRAGHEIGTAVILYGTEQKATPPGRYPVLQKIRFHHSSIYDAEMPYTLRLTGDGIAVHASDVRPGRATHGCIGLPREFARKVFEQMKVGDPVVIV